MTTTIDPVDSFIESNKQGLAFLLKLKSSDIQTSDIKSIYQRLAPELDIKMPDGNINLNVIDQIKQKQIRTKNKNFINVAIEAIDRASVFGKKISTSLKSQKLSPVLDAALEERRKELSRASFRKLAESFVEQKRHISSLRKLLEGPDSFSSPSFRFQINAHIKMLKSDLKKCDFHARASVNWALKSGVPLENAYNAIDTIYLRHLRQADTSFAVVDQLLTANGFKCNLGKLAQSSLSRWADDISEAKLIISQSQERGKYESSFGI